MLFRTLKEHAMYADEVKKQKDKIQQMIDSNADAYDIKKQREVLQESEMMLPDCLERLRSVLEGLTTEMVTLCCYALQRQQCRLACRTSLLRGQRCNTSALGSCCRRSTNNTRVGGGN